VVAKAPPSGRSQDLRRPRGRERILEAATQLFAERGFAAVSVQDIANEAGTHKTTVLYHFDTKEGLREAVLDTALGRIAGLMREFMSGDLVRERVAYLLDQIQAYFAAHPASARLLQRELLEPDASRYLRRFVEPIYTPALRSLERAMKAGRIRRVDPAFFVHDLHVQIIGYFCHGSLLQTLRQGNPYTVDSLIARRDYLVDQIFRQLIPGTKEVSR